MSGLLGVLLIVVGVLASIAIHEFGHFWFARRFGASTPVFAIGMGPRLVAWRHRGTEFSIRAFPVGGYVKILGMLPPGRPGVKESGLAAQARAASAEEVPAGAVAFWELAWWRRMLVLLAGPVANLGVWAVLSVMLVAVVGLPGPSTTLSAVVACPAGGAAGCAASPAEVAGLQAGDRVVEVAGSPVESWDDVTGALQVAAPGESLVMVVERGGDRATVSVVPGANPDGRAYVGVVAGTELIPLPVSVLPERLVSELSASVRALAGFPAGVLELARNTFSAESERAVDSPIGMIGVGRLGADVGAAESSVGVRVVVLLSLVASLNLFLFLFNMLPLLPLDGGHIAGTLVDALRGLWARWLGRPVPLPFDTARLLPVSYAVFAVLLSVSVLVAFADIVNPVEI